MENTKSAYELFKDAVTWVSPAVSAAARKRTALKSLNDKIGEWAREAKDGENWRQPILRKEALETHLLLKKGELQPLGECTSTFAWARLLYALNIRPDSDPKVLEWRQTAEEMDPTTTGTISLAIEGEALCDIVNLYQCYVASQILRKNECRFTFGTLRLSNEENHVFNFEASSSHALKASHKPFWHKLQLDDGWRSGFLRFRQNGAIDAYRGALDVGVSERDAELDSGKKPLQDRARSLLRAMALLNAPDGGDWAKGYLVTQRWIEEASAIKRRLTTDGGEDTYLVDFICRHISTREDVVSTLKRRLSSRRDGWEEALRETVETLCMFKGTNFNFVWDIDSARRSERVPILGVVKQQLEWVLSRLSEDDDVAWARELTQALTTAELVDILNLPHEIVNRPVIVIQQDPTRWDFTAVIEGK